MNEALHWSRCSEKAYLRVWHLNQHLDKRSSQGALGVESFQSFWSLATFHCASSAQGKTSCPTNDTGIVVPTATLCPGSTITVQDSLQEAFWARGCTPDISTYSCLELSYLPGSGSGGQGEFKALYAPRTPFHLIPSSWISGLPFTQVSGKWWTGRTILVDSQELSMDVSYIYHLLFQRIGYWSLTALNSEDLVQPLRI